MTLTCCRSIHLSQVPGWRYRRHHKVEGDGDVHGGHGIRACANHTDLVMGLEIHVGRAPCSRMCVNRTVLNIHFQLWKRCVWERLLTIAAAIINRPRNEGLSGIIHSSAHESAALQNKTVTMFFVCLHRCITLACFNSSFRENEQTLKCISSLSCSTGTNTHDPLSTKTNALQHPTSTVYVTHMH